MKLTTRETVAATLARETDLPIERIVDIVKRLFASASIVRDFTDTGPLPSRAVTRASAMLHGTGWQFVADRREPAIICGDRRIALI